VAACVGALLILNFIRYLRFSQHEPSMTTLQCRLAYIRARRCQLHVKSSNHAGPFLVVVVISAKYLPRNNAGTLLAFPSSSDTHTCLLHDRIYTVTGKT
jgi:hypothetical protein